ncbi:MAG: ArnT family glycosyltransferase [Gemmatimonadales bacterium]
MIRLDQALLLPAAVILGAAMLARLAPALAAPGRLLAARTAPLVVGIITAIAYWWVWGSLTEVPWFHDEAAYLLQAAILASGHWTAPGRPLPEFFEQFHVFVTPVLAPRYIPGHAVTLVPGVWLGLPGLVPVMLSGLTGGLIYRLARRLANPPVALLAWFLWMVTPGNLRYRPTYLSEITTGATWLLGWWALLEWRATDRRGWLLLLAALVGWSAITRPLTAIAFAIPAGGLVLWRVMRQRSWRDLGIALAVGAPILAIGPIYNQEVTGDWRKAPLAEYSKVYFPFDLPGFGLDSTPPRRELPQDMRQFAEYFRRFHRDYTPGALPRVLWRRTGRLLRDVWGTRSPALAPLAVLGLLSLPAEAGFALATVGLLLTLYLGFAVPLGWTVYSLEAHSVLTFVTALGIGRLVGMVLAVDRRSDQEDRPSRWALAAILIVLLALPAWTAALGGGRRLGQQQRAGQTAFRDQVAALPGRVIVFVRYSPDHDMNHSLIGNPPDLARASAWIVYDRGGENAKLMALAPDRTAYLYDEAIKSLRPLTP